MDGAAGADPPAARGAVLGLRGPSGVLAPGADVPSAGRPTPGLRLGPGLHPCGADAGGGAPLRRVVGLPGHRLLRADRPPRHPGRLQVPRRRAAPGRDRRPHGLGARPLPPRRLGAGRVRRTPAVRARGPAAGRPPRLGHPRVRLRAPRGPQLPRRQRRLLVRGVPHRRPARRRRRLHALPRLLARAGPVDAQRARRPREPRRGRLPPGDERHRVPARRPASSRSPRSRRPGTASPGPPTTSGPAASAGSASA